jgi:A/G-specific adenine glycosylase
VTAFRQPRDAPRLSDQVLCAFTGPLLTWYRNHKRDLPWRRRQDDPYAVWVSEIMLQQTQVATVIPYYERWMVRFPTLQELAGADLEEVLRHWAGLGYYARARNLHRAAQAVVANCHGAFPSDPATIESLPGIGRYTAGAIRSIAFNQSAPIVDANVIRVFARVFAVDGDPKSTLAQARLWSLAESLIPAGEARDFNQAVMELGALVCTPSDPACDRCPLLPVCHAGNSPEPTAWPQIAAGKTTVKVAHCSGAIWDGDRVLVAKRPPHGLWGGLWEFPRRVCEPGESPAQCAARAAAEVVGMTAEPAEKVATIKHAVTHHAITLHLFDVCGPASHARPVDCAEIRFVALGELASLPLSAPQRLLADALIERNRREHLSGRQCRLF